MRQTGDTTLRDCTPSQAQSPGVTVSNCIRESSRLQIKGHETNELMWKRVITLDKMWMNHYNFCKMFCKASSNCLLFNFNLFTDIRLIPRTAFSRYWVIVNEVPVVVTAWPGHWHYYLWPGVNPAPHELKPGFAPLCLSQLEPDCTQRFL